jgi:Mg-chelatase subunit ChlD
VYNVAEARFSDIARATGGRAYESHGVRDLPRLLSEAMKRGVTPGAALDIALVIDTTASMGDDIRALRRRLRALVDSVAETNPSWRMGIVEYRDTGDLFDARVVQQMTGDTERLHARIARLRSDGGGDFCEHVYAGLAEALRGLRWRDVDERRIILIGDAPPHEDYADDERRFDTVVRVAQAKRIQIHAIGAHCDEGCQEAAGHGCGSVARASEQPHEREDVADAQPEGEANDASVDVDSWDDADDVWDAAD